MSLTQREKDQIVTLLCNEIPMLHALYLFGSQSDGSASRESDVDIAFLSESTFSSLARWELSQKLASLLLRNVDLIDLKETNTVFRFQIISTAERMYGEGYDVEKFEMLTYSFYLRFQEERRPIVDAIKQDASVLGGVHV